MTVAVVFVALCIANLKLPDLYGLTQQSTGHSYPYLFKMRSSGPEESFEWNWVGNVDSTTFFSETCKRCNTSTSGKSETPIFQ